MGSVDLSVCGQVDDACAALHVLSEPLLGRILTGADDALVGVEQTRHATCLIRCRGQPRSIVVRRRVGEEDQLPRAPGIRTTIPQLMQRGQGRCVGDLVIGNHEAARA